MTGRLSVVATPIGNLSDISPRAVAALREADVVLAEDTRRTRGLLAHLDVHTPLESFDAHKERTATDRVIERIRAGARVALVSDAGTPGLSDPGGVLVRAALAADLPVSPIPGPSAIAAALSAAGVDGPFRFDGFLPRKGAERTRRLEALRRTDVPVVLFEAPGRLGKTLRDLAAVAGPAREAVVCRELTKLHEEIVAATLETLVGHFADEVLGEVTLVVRPDPAAAEAGAAPGVPERRPEPATLAARLREEGVAPSRIARILSDLFGLPHKAAYRIALDETVASRES